jgi:hypothetical protein
VVGPCPHRRVARARGGSDDGRWAYDVAFKGVDRDAALDIAEASHAAAPERTRGDEWFYGELEFDAATAVLRRCAPPASSASSSSAGDGGLEFVDLGSGMGKMCVAAALTGMFDRSRGVELLPELHNEARRALEAFEAVKAETAGKDCEITLVEGNLLAFDVSRADVVYIHATCFTPELLDATGRKLAAECRNGTRVIIMSKQFPADWVFQPYDGGYAALAQPQSKWKLDCFLYKIVK